MKRRYGANQLSCCAGLTELGHTEMCGIAHFKFSTTESHFCPRSYRRLTAPRLIEAVEPGASDYARERPLLSTSTGGGRFPRAVCRSVALHGLRFQEAKYLVFDRSWRSDLAGVRTRSVHRAGRPVHAQWATCEQFFQAPKNHTDAGSDAVSGL